MNVAFLRRAPGFGPHAYGASGPMVVGFGAPITTPPSSLPFPGAAASMAEDYLAKDSIVPVPAPGSIPQSSAAVVDLAGALAFAEYTFHLAVAAGNAAAAAQTTSAGANAAAQAWNNVAAAYFGAFDLIANQKSQDLATAVLYLKTGDGNWTYAMASFPPSAPPVGAPGQPATSKKWPWVVGGAVLLAAAGTTAVLVTRKKHPRAAMAGYGDGGSFGSGFAGGLVGGTAGAIGGLVVAALIERSALTSAVAAYQKANPATAQLPAVAPSATSSG